MEKVSSTPTVKQRRKFEHIEPSNISNHDTSFVNHAFDAYGTDKLSKCLNKEAHCQMLPDSRKEFIKKCLLQEENASRGGFTDPVTNSSVQKDPVKMNKVLLYVIPAMPGIILLTGSSLTYIICKYASHAESNFLYLSDVAYYYPESSIFALYMNIVAIVAFINTYLRHLQTLQFFRDCGQGRIGRSCVRITFAFALGVSLSCQIMGSFPSSNSTISMHLIAVVIFFICTIGYTITQSWLTYHMINVLCDQRIYYVRCAITTIALITGFVTSISAFISWHQFDGEEITKWGPNNGGWIWHVISVIGEWVYVSIIVIYIFTFAYEYRLMTFHMPVIKLTYLAAKEKTKF